MKRTAAGVLVAVAALAPACTSHPGASRPRLLPDTAGGPITVAYAYGSAQDAFIALPPRPGQRPRVSAVTAQQALDHPAGWPTGAARSSLVAFGYGRVTAVAHDAQDTVDPAFRHERLAWVAIYRSATAGMPEPACVAPAPAGPGEHVTAPRRPAIIHVAVIVDAVTGHQVTWDNLGDRCPRTVSNLPADDGRVSGRFLAVGGPVGSHPDPQRGKVYLRSAGRLRAVARVGPDGRFTIAAAQGAYALTGRTPQFTGNGHDGMCRATPPVTVVRGQTTRANVYCQRR